MTPAWFRVPSSGFRVIPEIRNSQRNSLNLKPGTRGPKLLFITALALLYVHEAQIFHQWPTMMREYARRLFAGVEMLVPAKHRDAQHIARHPLVAAIFDHAVALTG